MNEHTVPVEGVWLMREGGENDEMADVVVYVQRDGVWYEAIREKATGNFSHCISSHGLVDTAHCKPAAWLNKATVPPEEKSVVFDPQKQPWPDGIVPWSSMPYQPRDASWGYVDSISGRVHIHAGDVIITDARGNRKVEKRWMKP